MKKKILSLALALIMIISLLPMTTFALNDISTGEMKILVNGTAYLLDAKSAASEHDVVAYIVLEDDTSTADTTDKKMVVVTTQEEASYISETAPTVVASAPTDNYIQIRSWVVDEQTPRASLTFKNFDTTLVSNKSISLEITNDAFNDFDLDIILEGTNVYTSTSSAPLKFKNAGNVAISGSGSLEMSAKNLVSSSVFQATGGGLTITGATVRVTYATGSGMSSGITANGSIIIENATVEGTNIETGNFLRTATASTSGILTTAEIKIINSTVNGQTGYGDNYPVLATKGKITIKNSNVVLAAGAALISRISYYVPYLEGTYTAKTGELGYDDPDAGFKTDLKDFSLTAGDEIAQGTIRYLEVVHTCVADGTDDHNCLTAEKCACGKDVAPGKTAHIAGANADDCTKDTICGNPGCTQVFEAATATAHTPKADDGDCTTDILCANPGCTQVATKGAEKHKDTRTDCSVAGTCANTGCQHAFAAGQHNPEADDGDCTTDIKCATCGKVATKGEAAHKYTDKNDTTCDNAGCKNTRKVEGTENPKTGDNTVLVLALSLMAASAAAFVCTKKFAR